ncbi:MAG: porphobilinogen synthase [Candidatus Omnitrophota bacterium]|jgi:porphobilinogen synthase
MSVKNISKLRRKSYLRDWVSQTDINAGDLILPYFVVDGSRVKTEIKSMPGVYHLSPDKLVRDLKEAPGVKAVLLFGVTGMKDEKASEAYKADGVLQESVRAVKKEFENIVVITDVCLCGYTSHGHCAIMKGQKIDSDATLGALGKIAVSHADAGADIVAPSAMMDGQVREIRDVLDKKGHREVGILAYSAKYASNFYGPFREALNSAPRFGDRRSYQMDFRNSDEALREIRQDIDEGADIVMVKPALAYLDIIYRAKREFNAPIAAYNVSGEYSMVKKMSGGDKEKERELALEVLVSIKRAGADFIITYFAKEAIKWLS